MKGLIQFSIPFRGLQNGLHEYDFRLDDSFFANFENALIRSGNIQLQLQFDKRPDLQVLLFDFEGRVKTSCDRCLAEIELPVEGTEQLIIKTSAEEEADLDDPDVIFIGPEIQQLNVAPYIYEFVSLALPMIKTYDCEEDEPRPCNMDMLKFLVEEQEEQSDSDAATPSVWEELKNQFKKNEE